MSESRRYVLLRQTDAMGLTPVKDAQSLARRASSIEVHDLDSLVRLLLGGQSRHAAELR